MTPLGPSPTVYGGSAAAGNVNPLAKTDRARKRTCSMGLNRL